MFELVQGSGRQITRAPSILLAVYLATAVSVVPWTFFIGEMLGGLAIVGIFLIVLLVLGGYGIFKQWRGAKVWALLGPTMTIILFAISFAGLYVKTGGNQEGGSPIEQVFMLGSPLVLGVACLVVVGIYSRE